MASDREREALKSKIDIVGDHWIWTGKVNFFGSPVLPGHAQLMVSASEVVYHMFKGSVRPVGMSRQCEHELCVKPTCWQAPKAPRKAKEAPAPKEARRKAPKVPREPRKRGRVRCIRDHLLAETRVVMESGYTYCSACREQRAQEGAAKRALLPKPRRPRDPNICRKELCVRGHRMDETRRRWPSGSSYCSECQKARWVESRDARAQEAAVRKVERGAFPVDLVRKHYRTGMTSKEARELIRAEFPTCTSNTVLRILRKVRQENGDEVAKVPGRGISLLVAEIYRPGITTEEVRRRVWEQIPDAGVRQICRAMKRATM